MKTFAIIGGRKPPPTGFVAIICGALLGAVGAAAPAQSADLYYPYSNPYPYQYTGYGPGYSRYYGGCHSCGCNPCCNPCGYRPYVQPSFVVERHWTDYFERRYPSPYPYRYPYYNGYGGYPYYSGYGGDPYYSNGYGGYPYYDSAAGYPAYGSGPRPRLGFGGVQYPPAPISYEYQAPPGPAYGYEASARPAYDYEASPPPRRGYVASARPAYDYEASPRPPTGIPGAYSNAGYVE
jgi:hypothetical protein